MKTFQKTISLLLVLTILLGCQMPECESVDISISDDITGSNETSSIDISTSDIVDLFGVNENPFNHGKLRVSTLSGVHLNKIQQVKLAPVASMNEYQKYVREAEISDFVAGIDSLITSLRTIERGKKSSSLLRPMHKELRRLANSEATKRYAIYYTDLQENSFIFSSYSASDMEFLKTNPEEFTERVLQKAPLPESLAGIKVFIIHNPEQADSNFLAISEWYSDLLMQRDAEVYIGANLILD